MPPDNAALPDTKGQPLSLEGRVDVYPDMPLPELNGPGGPAYVARHRADSRLDMMAVICNTGLPARSDLVNAMRMIDNSSVLRLREGGVIHWPSQNARYYALAYERPLAPRWWPTLSETHPLPSEDAFNHAFVLPMIGALLEFQRTGVVHGSIRPTNIFWRDGSVTAPQLGECLSAPTGMGQPALFEPIERALCPPLGRGPGLHADDCYALGVTLALAVLGHNPLGHLEDQAIIQAKLERGSFNAFIGSRRLGSSHIELLRGLLADDARQRWSAADLEQWQTGRRQTPKSTDAGRRASRHFALAGKEYWQVRGLAAAMASQVSEAAKTIENSSLEKWLMRSLGDEDRAKEVADAVEMSKESGKAAHYEDQLVARVCIALDPSAPIRYRGLSAMPGGIASLLAEAMLTGRNLQVLSEIISSQFVTLWVNQQKDVKADLVPFAQLLERMRGVIERTSYGNGVERVVYELNPTLPCLSPMMRNQYVMSAKYVLPALERLATTAERPAEPMDRHLAAFLIVRDKRSEALFGAMSGDDAARRGVALLTLFSELQYRYGPDRLPGLSAWLLPLVEPGIRRFLNKAFRDKVKRQAKEAVEQGDLVTLLRLVNDPKRVEHDEVEFLMARRMYMDVEKEISNIEDKLRKKSSIAESIGRPVAATISSLMSIMALTFVIVRAVFHHL